MKPEKYGFTSVDLQMDDLGIEQCYRYDTEAFVVAEISDAAGNHLMDCYTKELDNMGGPVSDVAMKCNKNCMDLLNRMNCSFLLLLWDSQDEKKILFLSDTRRVRALEFLDYLIMDFGLVRGNASCAVGQISKAILTVQIAGMDLIEPMEYFLRVSNAYYEECDWIDAVQYGTERREVIEQMTKYYKQQVPWAYVKSVEVVPEGTQICIKSLENESGVLVTANSEKYIMIGCRGEVYDISREKFERSYEASEEALDVFEQMLDFLPALETVPEGEYISLDDVAKLCYPKRGSGIYACELDRRTKIFPVYNNSEYFLGMPGDYMAVRLDDLTDIYIIQREIFMQTYEESVEE